MLRLSLTLLLLTSVLNAETLRGSDPDSNLPYWEYRGEGIALRLTQRLPDQTRAFFIGRGFDSDSANLLATHCVMQSLFHNLATVEGGEVTHDLGRWRVHHAGTVSPMRVKEWWWPEWQRRNIAKAPRIAFDWSLLPTKQSYHPGDYNWGMSSFGLPPASRFDLTFHWQRNGTPYTATLEGVECAPDHTLELPEP